MEATDRFDQARGHANRNTRVDHGDCWLDARSAGNTCCRSVWRRREHDRRRHSVGAGMDAGCIKDTLLHCLNHWLSNTLDHTRVSQSPSCGAAQTDYLAGNRDFDNTPAGLRHAIVAKLGHAHTQNSALPGVRGNGITSRMFAIPVIN